MGLGTDSSLILQFFGPVTATQVETLRNERLQGRGIRRYLRKRSMSRLYIVTLLI